MRTAANMASRPPVAQLIAIDVVQFGACTNFEVHLSTWCTDGGLE
jgi:hypothetical protein